MTDKILFTKAAKRDIELTAPRLPNKFEAPTIEVTKKTGTYSISPDGAFLFLVPEVKLGDKPLPKVAIPINRVQTYIETAQHPVDPFAAPAAV